ncbi:MAG: sporulation transcription factor Spo0A [Oscillospiraceae bacterium]|jgi:two-component system response regulator (stage 0 sporulation protein A)|nr:sporulation transcription factor Spo0A [Oscillospiraceae bacterium]
MEGIRLVIVDDNLEVCGMLKEFFSKQDSVSLVGEAHDGIQALALIESEQPDVVLLDMVMPKMDGFSVLECLARKNAPNPPAIIALTALNRDDFIIRTIALGVYYYMLKPFDLSVLLQRVREAVTRRAMPRLEASAPALLVTATPQRSLDERITNVFLTIGIPAHIKGYQFLREAVKMVLDSPDMINRITKELYPGIARKFNTSSSKVERAIRHAIEVAWGRGRIDVLNQVFGHNVCSLDAKPTNGEFIALVSDKLALERSA